MFFPFAGAFGIVLLIVNSQVLHRHYHYVQMSSSSHNETRSNHIPTYNVTTGNAFSFAPLDNMDTAECWNDINLTRPPDGCGIRKCFFRSCSDVREGYIMAYKSKIKERDLKRDFIYASTLATRLHNSNFVGEPYIIEPNPPASIVKALRHLVKSNATSHCNPKTVFLSERNPKGIYMQRAKAIPDSSITITCKIKNYRPVDGFDKKFKEMQKNTIPQFSKYIEDKASFQRVMNRELDVLFNVTMVENAGLWRDFQLKLDRNGRLHHFDIDRAIDGPQKKTVTDHFQKSCWRHFRNIRDALF